jgi:branched-chain amino acid aminotransferase
MIPQAYLNGSFVPADQAVVSMTDGGFVQGTAVAEQLRTFGGKLFRLEPHVERLFRCLEIVGIDPHLAHGRLAQIAAQLVEHNHRLLAAEDDLGLAIVVTPGPYLPMTGEPGNPAICMHTFPLRFELWAEKYARGQSLYTTDVTQVPAECWPRELKCRSRMHYYLADQKARQREPGSRALMLDEQGFVIETTTANIVVYARGKLALPPQEKILPGISLAVLLELTKELGIEHVHRDLTPADVAAADEVLITGTSHCILPVVALNGAPIGSGKPGPVFARLLAAWSRLVGVDIAAQAEQFAARRKDQG